MVIYNNMDSTDDDIKSYLLLYFEGNLSQNEMEKVEKWIDQSDEHYKAAQQILTIYLTTESFKIKNQVDSAKAVKKFNARIRKRRFDIFINILEKSAAVICIPLATILLIYLLNDRKTDDLLITARANPGMTTTVMLPDDTKVHINSESSLTYPVKFTGNSRSVELNGEAYFEVTKNPKKEFEVALPHNAKIVVKGTTFNVEAYSRDSVITTSLLSGAVSFVAGNLSTNIKPGEKLLYNVNEKSLSLRKSNPLTESSWIDGEIVFKDTPLKDALHILSKRFNVTFVVTNPKYSSYSFTGSFTNQSLDQILTVFRKSSDVNWRYLSSDENNNIKIEIY